MGARLQRRYGRARRKPAVGASVKVKLPAGRDVQRVRIVKYLPDGRFIGANAANFERTFSLDRIVPDSTKEGRLPGFEDDPIVQWEDEGDE